MHRSPPCGRRNRPRRAHRAGAREPFGDATRSRPATRRRRRRRTSCDAICSRAWSATSDQPESSPESFAPAATPIASSDSADRATRRRGASVSRLDSRGSRRSGPGRSAGRTAATPRRRASWPGRRSAVRRCHRGRKATRSGSRLRSPPRRRGRRRPGATDRGARRQPRRRRPICSIVLGRVDERFDEPDRRPASRQSAHDARRVRTDFLEDLPPLRVGREARLHRDAFLVGALTVDVRGQDLFARGIRGSRECRSQKPPAAMDARPDGADRDALRARDLVVRLVRDVAEHDGHCGTPRAARRARAGPRRRAARACLVGRRRRRQDAVGSFGQCDRSAAALAPHLVQEHVRHDPGQPAFQRARLVTSPGPGGRGAAPLGRDPVRRRRIAGQPVGHVVEETTVVAGDLLPGGNTVRHRQ